MILTNEELTSILDERGIGYYWTDGKIGIRKSKLTYTFINYLIIVHSYLVIEVRPEDYLISLIEVDENE